MKKIIYSFILAFFFSNVAFSQMADGDYKFADKEITLHFKITDNGFAISSITLTNNSNQKNISAKGELMKAGAVVWYQFQTSECNYEFDVPTAKLILSKFECKNGQKPKKYQLSKLANSK